MEGSVNNGKLPPKAILVLRCYLQAEVRSEWFGASQICLRLFWLRRRYLL